MDPADDPPRYYRSPRGDEVTGPFTRAEIDAAIARGEIHAGTLLCVEGSEAWVPASMLLHGLRASGGLAASAGPARTIGLAWPIVATVLSLLMCCLPIGVVPLVLTTTANARLAAGDREGGERTARQARGWMIATWILIAISCAISAWTWSALVEAFRNLPGFV